MMVAAVCWGWMAGAVMAAPKMHRRRESLSMQEWPLPLTERSTLQLSDATILFNNVRLAIILTR